MLIQFWGLRRSLKIACVSFYFVGEARSRYVNKTTKYYDNNLDN